jgi:hypothetical protein
VNNPSVKVEKTDTVAIVKPKTKLPAEKTEFKPKPADTVAVVKKEEPKKSNITVGEEVKLPPPVKMKRIAYSKPQKLFTATAAAYKPRDIATGKPEIKLPEPPPPLPEAVKLASVKPSAIKKIKVPKPEAYTAVDVLIGLPEIKIKAPEAVKPAPVKMEAIPLTSIKRYKITKVPPLTAVAIAVAAPVINVKEPEVVPVAPAPVKMASVKPSKLKKLPTGKAGPFTPQNIAAGTPDIKVKAPEAAPAVVVTEVARPRIKMPKILPAKVSKWHLLYGGEFFDEKLKLIKLPPEPTFKPIATTIATALPSKPAALKVNPAVNTGEYSVTQEDAKETSMVVYMTNGKGKYFPVTPKIVLTDAATNKTIKTFTRFVDADGQPDPVNNIAAGKYYLTVEGRDDLVATVDLLPNKRTRVEIIVKKYSLYFTYEGAPNRPVKEFNARVIQRNVPNGRVVEQKCTEKLEYEPGAYHININTFPEEVRYIELDGNFSGIALKQPGFVKFTAEAKTNTVILHKLQGDRYVQFYTLNLSDPAAQHLQIQPGKYQAQYSNGTSKFSSSNRVIEFSVKALTETEVILK